MCPDTFGSTAVSVSTTWDLWHQRCNLGTAERQYTVFHVSVSMYVGYDEAMNEPRWRLVSLRFENAHVEFSLDSLEYVDI